MATHDYVIANASGAAVRADLNNALAAIVSNNSNATQPATKYAYQWWADTTAGQLKLRNAANDGWIVIQELDGTMLMLDGSAASPGLAFASDLDTGLLRPAANSIAISTAGVTRLLVNSSSEIYTFSNSNNAFNVGTAGGSGTSFLFWATHSRTAVNAGGTNCFGVLTSGNVVNINNSYGAISDIKLKENIVDANSQWDDLKSVRFRKYNFKAETGHDTHTQLGVVAQELELTSPGLVSESPDLNNEGKDAGTVTKTVNYSVLYMKAVKALQEAMTRIETLETKVAALEGGAS